ncbi:phosphoglucosamine mutase [Helcococcus ovis]|uniref:Phosphoglucosamine mutase n=1 Tax=Helcococcus ovis TaxID=72026 RepID=A0A4R9C4K9_9FIRM|nr:phosphoglucosamine mutase [Helcococcus ovis]TFF66020.1 phosphoglucosamine mutase [Helcococcus ovis]TFF66988.1 phosphoglucosamine mutase [Helcococcus ovis]TFF68594.1 phosphoglucosamine mutase [Helcococcus ovis]WNZ01321.1 phosphoglucosamine mutase [Helcococcus ovis]
MKYFGTDGFRGEANIDLNVNHAFKIGRFLGDYFKKQNKDSKIVIGKDTRRSSYMFESALAAGITSSGSDAYLLHVTTTPSVSYITRTEDFDCGIMISASHNPYYDNGIKLIGGDGYKLEGDILEEIEKYIDSEEDTIPLAKGENIGRTVDYLVGRNRYIAYLATVVTKSFKGIKVLVDASNGAAYQISKNVFDILGADVDMINDRPDGYNINKDAGSTHIENLAEKVVEGKYDLGIAYDGDADRCLAVDENGNIISGDHIMYIFGKYLRDIGELNKNIVVTTVMSNLGLYKTLESQNIEYIQTPVGDKYVSEEIRQNGYSVGGEQSGHIILSKYATTGDGILTSLKLIEIMVKSKSSLSLLAKELKIYPQLLENLRITDKNIVLNDEDVQKSIKEVEETLKDSGRILVRPSGTEPLIRVMIEAETDEICKENVEKVVKVIKEKGYLK